MGNNVPRVVAALLGGPELRDALIALGLAGGTITNYLRAIYRAQQWCEDQGVDLATVSASMIAAYRDTLAPSWATRNVARVALGHYWAFVGRADPPLKALRVGPKPQGVCRALEEDDARVLSKHATGRGDDRGLAVVIGLYAALRCREIATLRWESFDGSWLRVTGKGDKTCRIPVHPQITQYLDGYPRRSEFVFPGRFGGHVNPATIWQWSVDVARDAGLSEHVETHRLRHTCLATANDMTGDLRGVQSFARHSKPETTALYTRTTGRRLREIVDAIDYG